MDIFGIYILKTKTKRTMTISKTDAELRFDPRPGLMVLQYQHIDPSGKQIWLDVNGDFNYD